MLAPFFLNNITPLTQILELFPVSTSYCVHMCVSVCAHEGTAATVHTHVLPLISIFRLVKKEKEKTLFMPRPS